MLLRFLSISLLFIITSCGNDNAPSVNKTIPGQNKNDSPSQKQSTINTGDSSRTLGDMEKAYALNPQDENALYELAYGYAEAKNKKALSLSDTMLKYGKAETAAFAWYVKATYYQRIAEDKQALKFYDSSIVASYTFLDSYMDKGHLLFEQKNYKGALLTFGQGMNVASKDNKAEFYYWIGKTFEQLGDKQNAKDNYDRAYDLDKSIIEAKEASDKL